MPTMAGTNEEEKYAGVMIAGHNIPYSPIAQRKGVEDNVARRGVPRLANSETPEADGAKEHVSVMQSNVPPPQL